VIGWIEWHLRQQRSEVMSWEYYVFENKVEWLINVLQKKKDAEEKQTNQQNNKTPSVPKMQMPSMPNVRMPKL
jgi:hypothetical protein